MMMEITSVTNAKVKQWAKYKEKKYREADQRFLIEGEHLLQEAHRANLIECILVEDLMSCPYKEYPIYQVTPEILKKLTGSVSGSQIVAICHYPIRHSQKSEHILVLDGVQDPGNVGTILRTALSFSYTTVILSNHCADIYNDKVIRSTQGAQFHMDIQRRDITEAIAELKAENYHIYGTALQDAKPLSNIQTRPRHALIMGNEGNGITANILALCDEKIYIEMATFESLNVAVAAAICMYQFQGNK